jgi:filamentous hemagglutinin family protein
VASVAVSLPLPTLAQVVPDATLGTGNNSVTTITGDRTDITGGLRRNSALFHSFDRFSIQTNHQVYFANPANIRNIFSRVTGGSISSIDGLLGVSGSANLFLINPNGIVFGPNARLDISGAFLATTANALEFVDGQKFAATGDRAVPLVEVNIPIGLQLGANAPAMLKNEGNLTAGQDLTLAAGNLELQGQLQAGGNLTLQATDTVKIRDTVTQPFVARSGGNLTVQGDRGIDILALNHLSQTPFVSSGNLSLVSDGVISGDAHFASGGSFVIRSLSGQSANFVSLYDPIISSAGDIDIAGTYNGQALLVESLGNIRFQGSINITGNDPVFAGNPNPDLAILGDSAALIVRANRTALAFAPNVPPTTVLNGATFQPGAVPPGITIDGNISTNDGTLPLINDGTVILSATGRIQIGGTGTLEDNSILARTVTIDTPSTVQIAGGINARQTTPGAAGNIRIGTNTQPSAVTVGIISARNSSTGNGGDIIVNTTGNFTTTGAFGLDGSGYTTPGVTNPAEIVSIASQAEAGQSGSINIMAGGAVNLAAGISSASNFDGKGSSIDITGASIDTTRGVITSSNNGVVLGSDPAVFVANPGTGGDVNFTATTGDIRVRNINASSSNNTPANLDGDINLTATAGSIFLDQARLSTSNSGTHFAGDLRINAANQISVTNGSAISSDGYFGRIFLTGTTPTTQITLRDSMVTAALPAATALDPTKPSPSLIQIDGAQVTIDNSTISTRAENFAADPTQPRLADSGNISIEGSTVQILRNSQINTTSNFGVTGNSGDISIRADQQVIVNDGATIQTRALGETGIAGNITIEADAATGLAIQLENVAIDAASARPNSQTGSVTISAPNRGDVSLVSQGFRRTIFTDTPGNQPTGDLTIFGGNVLIDNYQLNATVSSTGGDGGSIIVDGNSVTVQNNSLITTATNGSGKSGDVTIQSTGDLTLAGGVIRTTVNSSASGNGGNISIASSGGRIELSSGFQVNSATNSIAATGGQGGNVEINSGTGAIVVNGDSTIDASTNGTQIGGNVSVTSTNQPIQLNNGAIRTMVGSAATADGGNITIQSNGGAVSLGGSDRFGINVVTAATNNLGTSDSNGRGGNVAIFTNGGQLSIANPDSIINANTTGSKNGGTVFLDSGGGNINLGAGSIQTAVNTTGSGVAGNGGTIALNSNGGAISLGNTAANTAFRINAETQATNAIGTSLDNGVGGNVFLGSGGGAVAIVAGSTINANTTGSKDGGTVTLFSEGGNIQLDRGNLLSTVGSSATGNGGIVTFNSGTGSISLTNQSTVNASTDGTGNAGIVDVDAASLLLSGNSSILSQSTNLNSDAGNLTVTTGDLRLQDSNISAQALNGFGGNIVFSGLTTLQLDNSTIAASTADGIAGNLFVNQTGAPANSISLSNQSTLSLAATGAGDAGGVVLNTQQLNLQNSTISAATNSGIGSDIELSNLNTLQLDNSTISTTTADGIAGDLFINQGNAPVSTIDLNNQSRLSLAATGNGQAGNILINTQQLALQNNSIISAETAGSGSAGLLQVDANGTPTASISLTGGSSLATRATGTGDAGLIALNTRQLTLQESEVTAATNAGIGSDIQLSNLNTLQLDNGTIAAATADGIAGNLFVNQNDAPVSAISLSNRSTLSLAATGAGDAGGVVLNTQQLTLQNSTISAATNSGTGNDIVLSNLNTLQLSDSQISASTVNGVAGNLFVNADNVPVTTIDLNQSELSLAATGTGNAGSTVLNAQQLTLQNSAISASTVSGRGSDIVTDNLNTLQLNSSQISASTQTGVAGNVNITATGDVTLNRGSRLSVEATGANGTAGNLTLEASQLRINQSEVTVSSPQGQAGNLTVAANDLRLDRGTLSAAAGGSGSGANIDLKVTQTPLLLRNGSLISASAGARANGGNIDILAPFILGLTFEDSDIEANAVQGQGGTIDISTNAIFGLRFRPKDTPLSDITASSEFGISGNVILNTLNLDPSRGLVELPTDLIDPTRQVAQGCAAGGTLAAKRSQFTISGRGGVPVSPTALLSAQVSTSDWVSLDFNSQASANTPFPEGALVALQPGQTYQVHVTCADRWKQQQRSTL